MNKTFTTPIDGSKLNASYGILTGIKLRSIDHITGIVTWNAVADEITYSEVIGSNLDSSTVSEDTVADEIRAEIAKLQLSQ